MIDIAVVVTCQDRGRWLEGALETVLAQSRPATELIVVDHGSTDLYTRALLASLERGQTRIIRTGGGLAAARNQGIRLTSAEYLVTLDAELRLDPEYLAKTAGLLDADPALAFVSTGIRLAGEACLTWTPPECTVLNSLVRGGPHPASMFRRGMWQAVGGFDESPALQSDVALDFWLSAMELGFQGVVIPEPLLEARGRGSSVRQTGLSDRPIDNAALWRKHRAPFAQLGPQLLIEKERSLEAHRKYQEELLQRRSTLTGELQALEVQIAGTVQELGRRGCPAIEWGDMNGLERFGLGPSDRGVPIEVFHIQAFLQRHAADQRGDVLEIRDHDSTVPPADSVGAPGVRDIAMTRRRSVTDLREFPDDSFDCVVAVEALHMADDVRRALVNLHRVLRPGGVLLCALPTARGSTGTSRDRCDVWRFTEAATRHLFADVFPPEAFTVNGYGNVLVCAASLAGLPTDALQPHERDFVDPMFPLGYCVRAVKPDGRHVLAAGHSGGC